MHAALEWKESFTRAPQCRKASLALQPPGRAQQRWRRHAGGEPWRAIQAGAPRPQASATSLESELCGAATFPEKPRPPAAWSFAAGRGAWVPCNPLPQTHSNPLAARGKVRSLLGDCSRYRHPPAASGLSGPDLAHMAVYGRQWRRPSAWSRPAAHHRCRRPLWAPPLASYSLTPPFLHFAATYCADGATQCSAPSSGGLSSRGSDG